MWLSSPVCEDTARNYTATVTNDWNANITAVAEVIPGTLNVASSFTYDNENRLTSYSIGGASFSAEHTYDGFNRLIKTDATVGVTTTSYEHTYDGSRHVGSIDVTNPGAPVNGRVWAWGGSPVYGGEVNEAAQWSSSSASTYFYLNDEESMSRRSYDSNLNAGDTTEHTGFAEWILVNGAAVGQRGAAGSRSELFSAYNAALDADRCALPARYESLMLAQTDLQYEGTRVKNPVIGRDLNPMGRGDGAYYADGGNISGGSLAVRALKPLALSHVRAGYGSSVNNTIKWPPREDLFEPVNVCPAPQFDRYCDCIRCVVCPSLTSGPPWWSLMGLDCCEVIRRVAGRDFCRPCTGWGYCGWEWDFFCSFLRKHPEVRPKEWRVKPREPGGVRPPADCLAGCLMLGLGPANCQYWCFDPQGIRRRMQANEAPGWFCNALVNLGYHMLQRICIERVWEPVPSEGPCGKIYQDSCLPKRLAICMDMICGEDISYDIDYYNGPIGRECRDIDVRAITYGRCTHRECSARLCCLHYFKMMDDIAQLKYIIFHEMIHCCTSKAEGFPTACTQSCYPGYISDQATTKKCANADSAVPVQCVPEEEQS